MKKYIDESYLDSKIPSLKITTITYDIETEENEFVAPYKYYLHGIIPDEDISIYGEPINITAWGASHEPVPITWYGTSRREYSVSTYYNSTCKIYITYIKLQ